MTPLLEDNTHSFIIRVWLESREIEGAQAEWRGFIEHVPTGEQRYLKNLADIIAFIRPYIESLGIKLKSTE